MRSLKTTLGILGALIPVVYCAGLAFYFFGVGGSAEGVAAIGLGPTVIGLGGVGLLLFIPLVIKLVRAVSGSGAEPSKLVREPEAGAGAEPEASSFDAEAALARYMAKKASGLVEAPPVDAAPRPVFGRKTA